MVDRKEMACHLLENSPIISVVFKSDSCGGPFSLPEIERSIYRYFGNNKLLRQSFKNRLWNIWGLRKTFHLLSPLLLRGIFYYNLGDIFNWLNIDFSTFLGFLGKLRSWKMDCANSLEKVEEEGEIEEALEKRPPALQIGKSWKVFQCFKTFLDSSLHLISWNEVCDVWYSRGNVVEVIFFILEHWAKCICNCIWPVLKQMVLY